MINLFDVFLLMLFATACAWLWRGHGIRERALSFAKQHCAKLDVELLDGAVALQFDVATPNFVIQEEAVGMVPWFEEICSAYPLELENGSWKVPEAPGLGIEIDEVAAARHPHAPEVIPALDSILPDGRISVSTTEEVNLPTDAEDVFGAWKARREGNS